MQKTKGDTFDLRAEEDAARRLNVGKAVTANASLSGLNSRAKRTDLIGKAALKERVEAVAKEHGVTFDTEASLHLLAAIEHRIRSLLSSSITAQTHRTNASYLYPAPIHSRDKKGLKKSEEREGKALWSHRITSDPNAVMEALNRQSKESEQGFRLSRMERLAQEASLQKARERAAELQAEGGGMSLASFDGAGPSTPMKSTSPNPSTPAGTTSTPMFGAIREVTPKSAKKSAKKIALDTSADVQFKMTNATAMRNAGIKSRKYGWMMGNAPAVSSPLAAGAKKRKAEKKEKDKAKDREKDQDGEKEALNDAATPGEAGDPDSTRPSKRQKQKPTTVLSAPARRLVTISKDDKGVEKRVNDDRVLTMVDVLFALEHGGLGAGALGAGPGEVGEIVQKIWARPGGPWGKDGWAEGKK